MASSSSFDIVSKFDRQELRNALDQARRDIGNRYDLKDTNTVIDEGDDEFTITTASEYSLNAAKDIIESKVIGRKISLKILDYQGEEDASSLIERFVDSLLSARQLEQTPLPFDVVSPKVMPSMCASRLLEAPSMHTPSGIISPKVFTGSGRGRDSVQC